jgi:nucleotide-binding universal stress UspA family protein
MQPFRSILVAADFSANSREAFEVACKLAVENTTQLHVLYVAEPAWATDEPVYMGQQTIRFRALEPDQPRHDALKRKLREVYAPHRSIAVNVETSEGDAAPEILRKAQEIGSDLIVIGTHGLTGLRKVLAGSVAIAVLHGSHIPVLALRSGAQLPRGERIGVILHPTDFSAGFGEALRVARSLARDHGARLILMHVVAYPIAVEGGMTAEFDVDYYRDALEMARELVDGPDLKYPVETSFCRGAPADEIVRVAKEVGCGLILMGTHGRTGLGRLLLGNTAESVLPEVSCPVMVVKSPTPIPTTTPSQAGPRHTVTVV